MRAALLLCVAACRPAPAPGPGLQRLAHASRPPANACRGTELSIDLPAPLPGGPSATIEIDRKGEGMAIAERATCVRIGGQELRLEPGEKRQLAIRADPRALQRLAVGGRPLLAHVAPGDDWMFLDHPCYSWQLAGPRTDPWFAPAPLAYCTRTGRQECRRGFFHPAPPRPVQDDICGDTEEIRRCAAAAEVRFAGTTRQVAPRDCGFFELETGTESVGLVVGTGEKWRLFLDASGRLQGENVDAGSPPQTAVDRG
jgi:hypothetical protein